MQIHRPLTRSGVLVGTAAIVLTVLAGHASAQQQQPRAQRPQVEVDLSVIDGRLYFSAADQPATSGRELWVSDGTAGGTRMLQDLNAGPTNSNPRSMVKAGDRIYLSAYKPGAGVELWSAPARRYIYLPLTRR